MLLEMLQTVLVTVAQVWPLAHDGVVPSQVPAMLEIALDGSIGVIRQGEPNELLIPLKLQKGKTILTLEYKW